MEKLVFLKNGTKYDIQPNTLFVNQLGLYAVMMTKITDVDRINFLRHVCGNFVKKLTDYLKGWTT